MHMHEYAKRAERREFTLQLIRGIVIHRTMRTMWTALKINEKIIHIQYEYAEF